MSLLSVKHLTKSFLFGDQKNFVLNGIDFELNECESVAIMGPSGSGKSTLLQILGLMLPSDDGEVFISSQNTKFLSDNELSELRRRHLGFVFQKFNLIGTLTAIENVAWPLLLDGKSTKQSLLRAKELLGRVGLSDRLHHLPYQLSGGQQQRVAIARALVAKPKIVFADEPTGALDSASSTQVLTLFKENVRSEGSSLVMVTHDAGAAKYCDRIFSLKDGLACTT